MRFDERVPEELIKEGHYLGRPADFDDKIVHRRVELVKNIPGFLNKKFELLDIGCGNGASLFLLANEFQFLQGIEMETIHQAEFENYKINHKIENVDFKMLNIETEKLEKKFDRLINFEVIEHLSDDKNVNKFADCLNHHALAAFTVPNKWWIFETHGANLPLLPWNRVPLFSWLPTIIHEKFSYARIYTKSRIRKVLVDAGFEILSMEYVTAPLDIIKEGKLKRFLIKYVFKGNTTKIPFLSTAIFIVARKK